MKSWLLAVVLVGCATNVNEEIDASGTVSTTLTWGGGNCAKSGTEPFTMFLAKNSYGSYDMTTNAIGQTINGNVVCGGYYCEIQFFKSWDNNNNDLLSLDGTLTLEGETNKITGSGTYKSLGECEHMATFAGALQ